jgi:hypothetical protein
MKLIPKGTTYKSKDVWGFPYVWLPFGKEGSVVGQNQDYYINKNDLINPDSLSTLSGRPIYVDHEQIELPIESDIKQSGVTTDVYRESQDGLGYEVLTRITCPKVFKMIFNKVLKEVSPCYRTIEGIRNYNHFGLFKEGGSRGGSKMELRLEGFGRDTVNLPLAMDLLVGIEINSDEQEFNLVNNIGFNMEELLGTIAVNVAALTSEVATIKSLVTTDVVEDQKDDALYMEGFTKGELSGKIFAEAESHGFVRVEDSTYEDAQRYIVDKAFPDLKVEGKTGDLLTGMYKTSLSLLNNVVVAVATTTKVEKVIPEVSVGNQPAKKKSNRYGASLV